MTTATASRAHGELDCADAEAILHETTAENADLRARLALALQRQGDLLRQIDLLRLEGDRMRALHDDLSRKNQTLADDRDSLNEQVKMLNGELAAIEADVVPEGTMVFGSVARDFFVSQYRTASRINRGPVPPAVVAAVEAARPEIAQAMTASGQEAVAAIVRREVRRRRRAQSHTRTRPR